jgi:hypothetical protein
LNNAPVIHQVDWGVAALYRKASGAPDYVLIYGTESDQSGNRDLLLARVRPAELEDTGKWEFFGGAAQWAGSPGRAAVIVKDVASELSVEEISKAHYIMVHSEPRLGSRIFVRTASAPEGPWSNAETVFTVSEVKTNQTFFAYAAKGHFALSKPGSLLISYIVNSNDFNELAHNDSIYRPKFITVPLPPAGGLIIP